MTNMQSSLGWTLLSREALRRAESQLNEAMEGVRDEIGFLALHQAYADRFFFGTSVLHTRLRYVLFVPWIYQRVSEKRTRQTIAAEIEKQELELTGRLRKTGEKGILGVLKYPNPTAQPPSMIYWSALGAWRILRSSFNGSTPSRQSVHRAIAKKHPSQLLHDDDKNFIIEQEPFFNDLPAPPSYWNDSTQHLDFKLEKTEKQFLRNRFLSVGRSGIEGTPSLLACLVDKRVAMSESIELWSPEVRKAADQSDQNALINAKRVAALSAIGRGVYAAMVEELRDKHDQKTTENVHRKYLNVIVNIYAKDALALNVDDILMDVPLLPVQIIDVLRKTQIWLRGNTKDFGSMYEVYVQAESSRKRQRARLPKSITGRERRAEWLPHEHPLAKAIHYRWGKVRQLLMDLQGIS